MIHVLAEYESFALLVAEVLPGDTVSIPSLADLGTEPTETLFRSLPGDSVIESKTDGFRVRAGVLAAILGGLARKPKVYRPTGGRPKGGRMPPETAESIRRLAVDGRSVSEIATGVGVSLPTVRKVLRVGK